MVEGGPVALGLQAALKDCGVDARIALKSDVGAATAIDVQPKWVRNKARHLDARPPRLQARARR